MQKGDALPQSRFESFSSPHHCRSTFKENMTCPYQSYHGHWLSSLTECLTLDVHPKGVPVGTTVNVSNNS